MNPKEERDFGDLAAKNRQLQDMEALKWENQDLRQEIMRLQILTLQVQRDAEEMYMCMRLLVEFIPKSEWRKKAQRAVALLAQKQKQKRVRNGYAQADQFGPFTYGSAGIYDGSGGTEYAEYSNKRAGVQGRLPISW